MARSISPIGPGFSSSAIFARLGPSRPVIITRTRVPERAPDPPEPRSCPGIAQETRND